MRQLLKFHPESRCPARVKVEVEVARPHAHSLVLVYHATGDIHELSMPLVRPPVRSDGLWRHTCFEAFVRASGEAYYEFNIAPTTEWAAYRFSAYRSGRRPAGISAPATEVQSGRDRYMLKTLLQLDSLADLLGDAPWHLGLSAVIEDNSGHMSYWALTHPPGQPDFHHSDSFAYELSPPVPA